MTRFEITQKNVQAITQALKQFRADQELLGERYADLLKRHPWCYVGVFRGEVYVGFTFMDVIEHFGDGGGVAIKHLNPNPPTLILAAV